MMKSRRHSFFSARLPFGRLPFGRLPFGRLPFGGLLSGLAFSLLIAASCAPKDPGQMTDNPDGGTPVDASERRCLLTAPRLGDSAAARAWAGAPAQCGQAAFKISSSQEVGDVVELGAMDSVPAGVSQVLLSAGKVQPRGPIHDVGLETMAYTTQDRGKLLSATAIVAYPTDITDRATVDVLLVLHGTSGFTDKCAPSTDDDTRGLVGALASLGYVAVAPDYIGLRSLGGPTGFLHPYLVGQATAIASLDAVRAASKRLARPGTPVCAGTRFATVGGSQGGHAALWVDRLAAYYAPELTHLGMVATVPPADLLGEGVRALRMPVPATLNLAAFYGASAGWYGYAGRLNEVFVSPLDKDLPAALATSCNPSKMLEGKGLDVVFQKSVLTAAMTADGVKMLMPWGCLAVENGLTTTSIPFQPSTLPGYGIMFLLGESDTLVDPPTERQSFDTLCAAGMPLQYLECAGASHTQATTYAMPEIVDFLSDRFAGKPLDTNLRCKRAAAVRCRATP